MEVKILNFFKRHIILTVVLLVLTGFIYYNFTRFNIYDRNTDTKDAHYINELYKSDNRIYNEHLTKQEQKMYDFLIKTASSHVSKVDLDLNEFECEEYTECGGLVDIATKAIFVDHPELMNFAGYSWHYEYDNNTFTLRIDYSYLLPFKEVIGILRIENVISDIKKATKDMTDKEKIIYVYDWMGQHNFYDKTFMFDSKNQSIYNVFVKGNAVCAGFAKASHLIFSQIGIESYIVQGVSTGEHMWNIVKFEDKYYYFDSTASVSIDESYKDYHYYGLTQEELNFYTVHYPNWYPKVESTNMFELKNIS
jgi:hypothetical protein